MIGYAYLDLDNNLVYKVREYIEDMNPGFFFQNSHLILKYWKFDTDDIPTMWRMFSGFVDQAVPVGNVNSFIKCIGFDMGTLKTKNADKI